MLPVFERRFIFLLDLNLLTHNIVMNALQLEIPIEKTNTFVKDAGHSDLRNLALAKPERKFNLKSYVQVFNQNHGFIPNLSILDLIFMEGPNSLNYLENQTLNF